MTFNIWMTADTHFGHVNALKFRYVDPGVETIEDHDEWLLTLWNDTVAPEDVVFVLGDFALGHREKTLQVLSKLHGEQKLLIPGNHDHVWPFSQHGEAEPYISDRWKKWTPIYETAGFHILPPIMWSPILGAWLSHLPYQGTNYSRFDKESGEEVVDDRFIDSGPKEILRGAPLIHGHVHNKWVVNGNMLNVGVDVWSFRPVPYETIKIWTHGHSPDEPVPKGFPFLHVLDDHTVLDESAILDESTIS